MTELNARIRLIPMPARIRRLPVNSNGFPIPWFVGADPKTGSRDDLRLADPRKFVQAVRGHLCWVCGGTLGKLLCFVVGPMCTVNRVSAEPPSHLDCAIYSVKACPFLSQPRMRRNTVDRPEKSNPPGGIMIERNPGVTALWITMTYHVNREGLVEMGDPEGAVRWYCAGRPAIRAEVEASIASGLPILRSYCRDPEEHAALDRYIERAKNYLPEAA